jgi:hypothetical protein
LSTSGPTFASSPLNAVISSADCAAGDIGGSGGIEVTSPNAPAQISPTMATKQLTKRTFMLWILRRDSGQKFNRNRL